jgi:hypothetical protein
LIFRISREDLERRANAASRRSAIDTAARGARSWLFTGRRVPSMCDYSLHLVANRPAKIEDKLVATKFDNSMTRMLTAATTEIPRSYDREARGLCGLFRCLWLEQRPCSRCTGLTASRRLNFREHGQSMARQTYRRRFSEPSRGSERALWERVRSE